MNLKKLDELAVRATWFAIGALLFWALASALGADRTNLVTLLVAHKGCAATFGYTNVENGHIHWALTNCPGEMVECGTSVIATMPPLYWHRCTVCGNKALYTNSYPLVVAREESFSLSAVTNETRRSR